MCHTVALRFPTGFFSKCLNARCKQECISSMWIKDTQYMNYKAGGNQAYVPTEFEHLANIFTHGFCVLPSLIALSFLVQHSSNTWELINSLVYGFALVALFSISTIFHCIFYTGRYRKLKEILHRCDRAIIYLFIAASYTPWLTLKYIRPGIGVHMYWFVWLLAFLGIVYQQIYHEKYKRLETVFYLLLGVAPSVIIFEMPEWSGFGEMAIGGSIYTLGIYFFKSDGNIPCAHAIWHVFVLIAAAVQYYAVCKYLLGQSGERDVLSYLL